VYPAVIVLALGGWGLKTWLYNRHHVNTDNAQVDARSSPVLAKVGGFVKSVNLNVSRKNQPGEGPAS